MSFFGFSDSRNKQLGDDQRGHLVLDLAGDEDDPFAQQAGENVDAAFAAARLFDDYGYQRTQRIDHWEFVLHYRDAAPENPAGWPLRRPTSARGEGIQGGKKEGAESPAPFRIV